MIFLLEEIEAIKAKLQTEMTKTTSVEQELERTISKLNKIVDKSMQDSEKIQSLTIMIEDQENTIEQQKMDLQKLRERSIALSVRTEEGQKSAGILAANKAAALQHKIDSKEEIIGKMREELKMLNNKYKTMKLQFEKGHNKLREEVKLKLKEREQEIAELKSNFVKEREELKEKIAAIISKTGASTSKDMGKVMGMASKELSGNADGKRISTIVKSLLAG